MAAVMVASVRAVDARISGRANKKNQNKNRAKL